MMILIVDDEAGIRRSLEQLFSEKHEVKACEDGKSALAILEKNAVDLVISDNQMPGFTGIELLKKTKEISPGTNFILMTAFGTVEQAIEAIRLGADDYIMKPFDLSEVEHRVSRIEKLRSWSNENVLKDSGSRGISRLVGGSAWIEKTKTFIEKVTKVASPVLLLGPSGSGKEIVAQAIHESGERSEGPFVAINCASLSEQLMESELFGHEKGAFTGATASKPGKFELAKGGTIFLDEVAELSTALQAKLLRVLQEKEFFRVGGVRKITSDARVIAATHQPVKEMVVKGTFREDLYFRLNVLFYELEPLAKRREDIPVLIDFFWKKLSKELGNRKALSGPAKQLLMNYDYPGNVRELQNVLERMIVLGSSGNEVDTTHLPSEFSGASGEKSGMNMGGTSDLDLPAHVERIEQELIAEAMRRSGGNQTQAANLLKITRGSLQYKLKASSLKKAA